MLNPTAQRTAGIFALTLAMLAGARIVPSVAQTTPPPVTTPPVTTPPATTPPATTPPAQTPPAQTPPAQTPPAQTPPAQTPPAQTPPAQTPPATTPPVQTPPVAAPPAQAPPAETPAQPPAQSVRPNTKMTPSPMAPVVRPPVVKLPPNVVAVVDGTQITRDDVLGMFEMVHGRSVVNQLIQIKALQAEAKRQGVTVSPSEVAAATKKIKEEVVQKQYQSGQGPMEFAQIAKEQGFTPTYIEWDAYLETLRTKTFTKAMETRIPPLADQIKVAHILIATIPLTNNGQEAKPTSAADQEKKDADAKIKIEGILAQIKAGKIAFEDAAKTYSDDKSNSADGGALPYAPRGTFDKGFESAAFGMTKVGEVVGPIKSRFGWHLIKMIAIGKDASPIEQKAYHDQQIDQIMKNPQSMQYWFNEVIQKSKISINPAPVLVPNSKSPLTGLNLPQAGKSFLQ